VFVCCLPPFKNQKPNRSQLAKLSEHASCTRPPYYYYTIELRVLLLLLLRKRRVRPENGPNGHGLRGVRRDVRARASYGRRRVREFVRYTVVRIQFIAKRCLTIMYTYNVNDRTSRSITRGITSTPISGPQILRPDLLGVYSYDTRARIISEFTFARVVFTRFLIYSSRRPSRRPLDSATC